MRTLFISNEYPFPPRSGVTVPAAAYARGILDRGHKADFLLLKRPGMDPGDISTNASRFDTMFSCPIQRMSSAVALWKQFRGRLPYFAAWSLESEATMPTAEPYDLIWVTPRAVLSAAYDWRERSQSGRGCLVAAVNDVASLRLERMAESALPSSSIFERLRYRMKALTMARSESRMLKMADRIAVQTHEEMDWLRHHSPDLVERVLVLPNGVDAPFFEIPLERTEAGLIFVGALTGMYAERVDWFLQKVWPEVRKSKPQLRLNVVGRCRDQKLIERIEAAGGTYQAFIEDPTDLYRNQAILVAPIFKGYGLINKVLQAMAGGTLVIGDATAYNGIPEFDPQKHGLVANTAPEFAQAIGRAVNDPDFLIETRENARALMEKHFSWPDRIDQVCALEKRES